MKRCVSVLSQCDHAKDCKATKTGCIHKVPHVCHIEDQACVNDMTYAGVAHCHPISQSDKNKIIAAPPIIPSAPKVVCNNASICKNKTCLHRKPHFDYYDECLGERCWDSVAPANSWCVKSEDQNQGIPQNKTTPTNKSHICQNFYHCKYPDCCCSVPHIDHFFSGLQVPCGEKRGVINSVCIPITPELAKVYEKIVDLRKLQAEMQKVDEHVTELITQINNAESDVEIAIRDVQ